jgi:MFS family permease
MYQTKTEKNYLWIFFTMLSIGLGQSLVFTSIPIFARENGLNEVEVSLIFGISAFAWFFASPFWGRYSEKLGSRTVGIIGSIGYSANMILIILPLFLFEKGYITSGFLLPALIASRLIYGIFGSATRPALFGFAGKISSPDKRAAVFSNLESGFVLGTLLGPLIGAFLFRYTNN